MPNFDGKGPVGRRFPFGRGMGSCGKRFPFFGRKLTKADLEDYKKNLEEELSRVKKELGEKK